jgi:hypothetical protein
MAANNEVVRRSLDEVPHEEPSLPMLEKPEPPKAGLHPAFFVVYVQDATVEDGR